MSEQLRHSITDEEAEFGNSAHRAARFYIVFAGISVALATVIGGAVCAHFSPEGGEMTGFLIGSVFGFFAGLANFFRVQASMADVRRRQLYMDRH